MKRLYILALTLIAAMVIIFSIPVPKEKITTEHQESSANLSESYPEHPRTLQDCENTSKRNFCIDDIAEISNNISLCLEISDADIGVFCRARILLDDGLCSAIGDPGLEEACLESVKMKKEWMNGNISLAT
jgi:hypothetical protein